MTLDELQKLCDKATPAHKPLNYSGIALDVSDADLAFIDAARTCMPKLVEIARAARAFVGVSCLEPWEEEAEEAFQEVEKALAALES